MNNVKNVTKTITIMMAMTMTMTMTMMMTTFSHLHLAATVSSNSACSTGSHKATHLFSVLCSDDHFDYEENNGKDHDDMDL